MNYNLTNQSEVIRKLIVDYASRKVPQAISGDNDVVRQRFANFIYTIDSINASEEENLGNQRQVKDYKFPTKLKDLFAPEAVKLVNTVGTPDLIVRPEVKDTIKIGTKDVKVTMLSPVEFNVIASAVAESIQCDIEPVVRSVELLSGAVEGNFLLIADVGAVNPRENEMPIVVNGIVGPLVDNFKVVNGVDYNTQVRNYILFKLTK